MNALLTLVTAVVIAAKAMAQAPPEDLLALWGGDILTVDPSTFSIRRSVSVLGNPLIHSVAYHDGRVVGVNDFLFGIPPDWLVAVHPADGAPQLVGWLGVSPWANAGIDHDPTTGLLWGINSRSAYTIDLSIGVATFRGWIQNIGSWEIASMAFEPSGTLLAMPLGVPRVWRIDMTTLTATSLGTLALPYGNFWDLACSQSGQLVGMFNSLIPSQAPSGMYEIDLPSLTATLRMPGYFDGLAFVPRVQQSTYCTSKPNSLGCLPTIDATGWPSSTAQWGYEITCTEVRNQQSGVLAWSASGRVASPFQGGTWCVRSPLKRTPVQSSGGNSSAFADCSGEWTLDFNTYLQGQAALPAGLTIDCQWYGRDPGLAPPHAVQFSDALEFVLMP